MKKFLKGVIWTVCAILLFIVLLFMIHPLWVGPTGAGVARSVVPDMTKSDFGLDALGVNLYSGKVSINGVSVKNPGDAKTEAVSLKALNVTLSTTSMLTDERHINEIVIDGLKVYGDMTFSNLRQIVANINEYLGEEKEEPEESKAKLVIDRVFITGTEFKWGLVKVSVPDIELKDIGKDKEATNEDVFKSVLDALCAAADKVVAGSGKALKFAIESGNKLAEGVKAVSGAVSNAAGAVGDTGAKTVKEVNEAAAAVGEKAVEVGGQAVEGVKKGLDGVKNILKF